MYANLANFTIRVSHESNWHAAMLARKLWREPDNGISVVANTCKSKHAAVRTTWQSGHLKAHQAHRGCVLRWQLDSYVGEQQPDAERVPYTPGDSMIGYTT